MAEDYELRGSIGSTNGRVAINGQYAMANYSDGGHDSVKVAKNNGDDTWSSDGTLSEVQEMYVRQVTDDRAVFATDDGVYIYELSGGSWSKLQLATLNNYNGSSNIWVTGVALSPDGAWMAMGVYDYDERNTEGGRVEVWYSSGGSFSLSTTIDEPDGSTHQDFGAAVAISNSGVLVIGRPGESTGGSDRGKAYIYSTGGSLQQTIERGTPTNGAEFGKSVAVSNDAQTVIIGDDRGVAHRFLYSGGSYTEDATFWSQNLVDAQVQISGDGTTIAQLNAPYDAEGDVRINGDDSQTIQFSDYYDTSPEPTGGAYIDLGNDGSLIISMAAWGEDLYNYSAFIFSRPGEQPIEWVIDDDGWWRSHILTREDSQTFSDQFVQVAGNSYTEGWNAAEVWADGKTDPEIEAEFLVAQATVTDLSRTVYELGYYCGIEAARVTPSPGFGPSIRPPSAGGIAAGELFGLFDKAFLVAPQPNYYTEADIFSRVYNLSYRASWAGALLGAYDLAQGNPYGTSIAYDTSLLQSPFDTFDYATYVSSFDYGYDAVGPTP